MPARRVLPRHDSLAAKNRQVKLLYGAAPQAQHRMEAHMNKFFKVILKIASLLSVIVGVLFVVYFWNLDQKLMSWVYIQVNRIHDRKNVDIRF